MDEAEPVVQLDRVSRVYRHGDQVIRALDEVSLVVGRGSFVALFSWRYRLLIGSDQAMIGRFTL
jgi:hypothetical protein